MGLERVADSDIERASAAITGTLASGGNSPTWEPTIGYDVVLTLSGAWTGTVKLQRSRDKGTTWADITVVGSPWGVFTANCDEPVDVAQTKETRYRLAFTGTGTPAFRLGH